MGVAALLDVLGGEAGRAPSGGLRSCACSRTGWGRHHHHRAYLHQLQSFVEYCNTNFLQLNISKTKEMVIDFRRSVLQPPPVFIDGVEVERVSSYKYLGVHLTDSLTWGDQVDALIKKLNSRLYCLRKMAIFKVRTDVMNMFYNATIYGVWRYCLITWGGNVTKADKERIDSIIRKSMFCYQRLFQLPVITAKQVICLITG